MERRGRPAQHVEMISGRVIADSSPLIALERIGRLDLLAALFGTVVVPPAVAREIAAKGFLATWMIEHQLLEPRDRRLEASSLGAGEREAITLALQITTDQIILDDEAARRLALSIGLPVTGTLGLLILAKRAGIVDAIRPIVDALIAVEFRVDTNLRTRILATAGELD